MKRSELFFSVLLIPIDFLALSVSFALAYYIRDGANFISPDDISGVAQRINYTGSALQVSYAQYWHYLIFILPVMLGIFALSGLYALRNRRTWLEQLLKIFIGVSVGEFFILILFLLKKTFFLPRATVLYSWLLATVFVFLGRLIIQVIQRILFRYNIGVIRIGVVGKSDSAEDLLEQFRKDPLNRYKVVAHWSSQSNQEILHAIETRDIDQIVVISTRYSMEDLITLRNHCLENHIEFSFVPAMLAELPSAFGILTLGKLPVIEIRPTPLEGWGRILKRIFDLIVGSIFIIIFSPVFLIIIVAMLFTDRGPLIYRHRRIGRGSQPIDILKFRTMRWEYCDGPNGHPDGDKNLAKLWREHPDLYKEWQESQKLAKDPRISLIGKILRKTSLDELPQLFNVLSGELSLVGPRPIVAEELVRFGETARVLFSVKPGVTGLWQVEGRYDLPYDERVRLNLHYIEHWNLWLDMVILTKTAFMILGDLVKAGRT